jgi:hypothetical protein
MDVIPGVDEGMKGCRRELMTESSGNGNFRRVARRSRREQKVKDKENWERQKTMQGGLQEKSVQMSHKSVTK